MRRPSNDALFDWFIRSDFFEMWDMDNRGNQMFLQDPERADRLHEAAEEGIDGSFTFEIIQDWRDAIDCYERDTGRSRICEALRRRADDVEKWHDENGTLYE